MIRPVDAPLSQRFGDNPTKNLPASSWLIQTFGNYQPDGHSGQDYACDIGTPVRAVADGVVKHIGWMGGTYADNPWWIAPNFAGYVAVIDHGSFVGIYGHCKDGSAKVRAGDRVSEGQVFILSGNTGGSTGPHLHFEILPDGGVLNSKMYGRIDPEPFFTGSLSYAGTTTNIQEEDDMGHVDSISDDAAAKIAGHLWNFDYKTNEGRVAKPLWVLQSLDAIIRETIAKTAQATAQVVLTTQLPNVMTGGKTTLGTQVSWLPQDFKAVRDAVGDVQVDSPTIDAAEIARLVSDGIQKATDGLSITLTAQKDAS